MNLIMGRHQAKRQEPQCVPLHQQQQQQQQQQPQIKHTPPPPPPPPPPCADDSWELQYCKWWGWNWVKKEHSETNKYASSPCEGPTRDNLLPMRCPVMPMKRVDKNNNRFKDFCNCLFSPNRRTAESLQRLYSTPSNSLIYESLCCGNQERDLDSYTCMELRNKSNKNTPNKRSQEKMCKCAQEQVKKNKEKRKKYCTCKESSTSLSNCCNCKEKEPPKKGCSCKESKAAAKKACNCKESSSNLQKKCCNCKDWGSEPPKKCCNCKDSNNNLIKCCDCNETTCPKKCCCGCMEPSNVVKKCCGCLQNQSNAINCCGCPKKSEENTITFDCPCQTKPETKCSPCQTIKTNMCECLNTPEKCTCCCHCNCYDTKPPNQPKCRRDETEEVEDEEYTCAICKAKENKSLYSFEEEPKKVEKKDNSDLRQSISQQSARKFGMFSYYIPKYNQILTKNQEIMVKQGIQSSWNHPQLLLPPEKLVGKPKFHEEQTNYAFTQENCQHCKWTQTFDHSKHTCTPNCPCTWCKSPPSQCRDCPWTAVEFPFKHSSAQTIEPKNYPPIPIYNEQFSANLPCPYCSFNSTCAQARYEEKDEMPHGLAPWSSLSWNPPLIEPKETTKRVSIESKTSHPSRGAVQRGSSLRASDPKTVDIPSGLLRSAGVVHPFVPVPQPSPEPSPEASSKFVVPPTPTPSPMTHTTDLSSLSDQLNPSYKLADAASSSSNQPRRGTIPMSDSIIDFARIRQRPFEKSRVLPRLRVPASRTKNSPSDILSKYYDITLDDSDLRMHEYTDYVNNIESKIVKKLKSRLLLDVFTSVLESAKKDIVPFDKDSISSDSKESDQNESVYEQKRAIKAINKLLNESQDRKVSARTRQKRRGSPVKSHPVKKFKQIDTNTDSSGESAVDNLFDKIDKITKESRTNVAKLQDAVNSLSRSKKAARHGRKNQPINPQFINKLYEIISTVADEDAVQNIFDIASNKKARERGKSNANLFENNDFSENWSSTSFSNEKPDYSHPKPTTSYQSEKDSTRRYEKNSKVKSKSKIPVKKAKPKLK